MIWICDPSGWSCMTLHRVEVSPVQGAIELITWFLTANVEAIWAES